MSSKEERILRQGPVFDALLRGVVGNSRKEEESVLTWDELRESNRIHYQTLLNLKQVSKTFKNYIDNPSESQTGRQGMKSIENEFLRRTYSARDHSQKNEARYILRYTDPRAFDNRVTAPRLSRAFGPSTTGTTVDGDAYERPYPNHGVVIGQRVPADETVQDMKTRVEDSLDAGYLGLKQSTTTANKKRKHDDDDG